MLVSLPERAVPSRVRAAIATTAIRPRIRPYSASAWPSSSLYRTKSLRIVSLILEIIVAPFQKNLTDLPNDKDGVPHGVVTRQSAASGQHLVKETVSSV